VSGTPAALTLTADRTILASADGTDDAQLVVKVADEDGRSLSNTPPVTLTVVSGPGEFPTGPSIAFAPDSDIAIRDGEAAIELRSYHAGDSVIRATSPGLADATITITTLGEPTFVPGETPAVKPRPYVRFAARAPAGGGAQHVSRWGRDNPTRASSEAPGHAGALGNDASEATFWQAQGDATNAWWQVDLERVVVVSQLRISFPSEGNYRYRIDVSDDQTHWKTGVDQSHSRLTQRARSDTASARIAGRFVRVTFTGLPPGKPAALAELEIVGRLAQP
jgi:hypothetical protein